MKNTYEYEFDPKIQPDHHYIIYVDAEDEDKARIALVGYLQEKEYIKFNGEIK